MKKKNSMLIIFCCSLVFICLILNRFNILGVSLIPSNKPFVVLIDAGHGGSDPGKVGINDALEKDINLAISLKLKKLLEQNDVKVYMTREIDTGLYQETDSNKKNADLKNRKQQIIDLQADAVISIHQNSFPTEKEKGAQVFYYVKSPESKELAAFIQDSFKDSIDPDNRRQIKSNDTYYILKANVSPMVIVECGFLSNWEESGQLVDDTHQEKVAWAIHLGVLKYLTSQ